jgi:hypothetical protein
MQGIHGDIFVGVHNEHDDPPKKKSRIQSRYASPGVTALVKRVVDIGRMAPPTERQTPFFG